MKSVVASFGAGPSFAVKAIAGALAYGVVVLTVGRKVLAVLGTTTERLGKLTPALLAVTLSLLMLVAWVTDAVGIHAVFGGFLLGVAMPRGLFARELRKQLSPFTVALLTHTDGRVGGIVAVIRDETARRAEEQELRQQVRELQEAAAR